MSPTGWLTDHGARRKTLALIWRAAAAVLPKPAQAGSSETAPANDRPALSIEPRGDMRGLTGQPQIRRELSNAHQRPRASSQLRFEVQPA